MADRDGERGTNIRPKHVAFAVVLVLLVAFGVANSDEVEVSFLVGDADVPLILALALAAVLGAVVALLGRALRRD
jgi:uncharacterized integral membrane protein